MTPHDEIRLRVEEVAGIELEFRRLDAENNLDPVEVRREDGFWLLPAPCNGTTLYLVTGRKTAN